MSTLRHKQRASVAVKVLGIFMAAMLFTACQRKCQQNTQRLTNIDGTEFRMVESTDPDFGTLTNTNFLIMAFRINYVGDVFRVENNDRYDNPVLNFQWNVDSKQKLIRLQYEKPPTEEGGEGEPFGPVRTYKYKLTTGLEITDTSNGYYYRMVPFQGVVHPDDQCTF